ncbi:MAG: Hsp70 family protein [Eubacteriales bacterium]|nr:Hsp70 family protein [Eubacteriales bacterium]
MGKIIGIDFGTTNSCVAIMEGGKPTVITNAEGSRTTPSVVAFLENGEALTGDAAKARVVMNPDAAVCSIVRDLGTDRKTIFGGRSFSPQEISAMILQKLKIDAESYLGETVTDAVIAVPVLFTDRQRQSIRRAGETAGLNVRRLISAASASALVYGYDIQEERKILVVDVGGGTLDVSVMEIGSGLFEVMSADGSLSLGGDEFDQKIADYISAEFNRTQGIDLSKDSVAMQRIREAAKTAKTELSGASETRISIPYIAADETGFKNLEMVLTQKTFNELIFVLAEDIALVVRKTIEAAEVIWVEGVKRRRNINLDKVILVGGCARIPALQEKIKQLVQKKPYMRLDPNECVAMGAAIQGGILSGQVKGRLLLEVTPYSLGIGTDGGAFIRIIEKNTKIPAKKSQVFSTAKDSQISADISVFQGESENTSQNMMLGRFTLEGITPTLKGIPQIEVTFEIDANGIISVSAKNMETGKKQSMTFYNQETDYNKKNQT